MNIGKDKMNYDTPNFDDLSDATVSSLIEMALAPRTMTVDDAAVQSLTALVSDDSGCLVQLLVDDLNCRILSSSDGPISFQRLIAVSGEDVSSIGDLTFLDALQSPTTSREILEHLFDFGGLLVDTSFPDATRLTGSVVQALALAALCERYGVQVENSDCPSTAALLDAIAGLHPMSPSFLESVTRSTQVLRSPLAP